MSTLWWDLKHVWRWVTNAECEMSSCGKRRTCWRWHLETIDCPTCDHACTEDKGPEFVTITNAILEDRVPGWHKVKP